MGKEWVDKCERSLYLSKRLGNIYTGSLYNGLLSLICDPNISLQGKTIMMFSYGSGCAASMFVLRVTGDYSRIQKAA
jgi:hydroxymethylglutaryl-CoA synthase